MARTYPTAPCARHALVTPGSGVISPRPEAIYVNSDGVIIADDERDVTVTYNVKAGQNLPFIPKRILTGTTAAVIAWW